MNRKVNEIFRTKDFGMFKFHDQNRGIIEGHVNRLYQSMLKNGWLHGSYVVIDRNGNVIDGQHRLKAAMKANIPVDYVVEKSAKVEEISKLNTNSRNWNIIDHLNYYVKLQNPHYVVLDKYMKNFPDFRPTECMMLVKNSTSSSDRSTFERGEFKTRDMNLAYDWGRKILSLKPYFRGYNKSIFIRAMIRSFQSPQFDFDQFLRKVELRPMSIFMCSTIEDYITMIENIYNYYTKNGEKIRLRE